MTEHVPLPPPPVEPLSDAAWARVERGLWPRVDAASSAEPAVRPRRWIWIAAPALATAAGIAIAVSAGTRRGPPAREGARLVSTDSPSELSYDDIHVSLDAYSAVTMGLTPGAMLERGGAWFTVPPRGDRPPFVVRAGDTVVRVVGTKFRVARDGDHATVDVEHGAVEIQFHGATARVGASQAWSSRAPSVVITRLARTAGSEPAPALAPPAPLPSVLEPPPVPPDAAISSPTMVPPSMVPPKPPPWSSSGTTSQRTRPGAHPVPDADEAMFWYYQQLEPGDPAAAVEGYLLLSRRGRGTWAENALYAAGRLSADRGLARARELLELYLARYPRGRNAKDAQLQLEKLTRNRP